MTTGVEVASLIRSVSSAIGLGKTMMEVAQKSGNMELINAIVDLNRELADVKLSSIDQIHKITELKQEIVQLKEKNKELEELSKEDNQLILKNNLFYKQNDEGPFCPRCYNNDKSRSLLCSKHSGLSSTYYLCVVCNWESSRVAIRKNKATNHHLGGNISRVEF
jgi:hypothetical protein